MSGELVARLRDRAVGVRRGLLPLIDDGLSDYANLLLQAAEEIERLKLALDEYQNHPVSATGSTVPAGVNSTKVYRKNVTPAPRR